MGWFWGNRREENHQRWEDRDTRGAIRAKAREAQTKAAEKQRKREAEERRAKRRQRNNRREY